MSDGNAQPPEQPSGSAASLSFVRAGLVLIGFVVAIAILVAVGTRPTATGEPSTTPTTAASTTTTVAGHATSSTTTTTAPRNTVSVVVANATSTNGLAAHYSTIIGGQGWAMKPPADASTTEAVSSVYYAAGQQAAAASIATTIGVKPAQVLPLTSAVPVSGVTGTDVVVVIGQDLASGG
jgi:hypothetical protein